jgi:hypothetical protein
MVVTFDNIDDSVCNCHGCDRLRGQHILQYIGNCTWENTVCRDGTPTICHGHASRIELKCRQDNNTALYLEVKVHRAGTNFLHFEKNVTVGLDCPRINTMLPLVGGTSILPNRIIRGFTCGEGITCQVQSGAAGFEACPQDIPCGLDDGCYIVKGFPIEGARDIWAGGCVEPTGPKDVVISLPNGLPPEFEFDVSGDYIGHFECKESLGNNEIRVWSFVQNLPFANKPQIERVGLFAGFYSVLDLSVGDGTEFIVMLLVSGRGFGGGGFANALIWSADRRANCNDSSPRKVNCGNWLATMSYKGSVAIQFGVPQYPNIWDGSAIRVELRDAA